MAICTAGLGLEKKLSGIQVPQQTLRHEEEENYINNSMIP